ncbi:MAG: NAD(P)/FAD-dependent oxidoreductase [Halothiobacillaceae bacterium]
METLSIAVIGAGMAGASCAAHLAEAGCRVQLFDKSRGAGGRMATRRGRDASGGAWQMDHGAVGLVFGQGAFAEQAGRWADDGLMAPWRPRVGRVDQAGEVSDSGGSDNGCLRSSPLPGHQPAWVGLPGMSAPARALIADLPLCSDWRIGTIARGSDGGWWVGRSDATEGPFDVVVVALVPVQAAELLVDILPSVSDYLRRVPCDPRWTVLRVGGTALSGVCSSFDVLRFDNGPIELAVRNDSRPGRRDSPGWVLHARREWSRQTLYRRPGWVSAALEAAFAQVGSPGPAFSRAHRWRYGHPLDPNSPGFLLDSGIGLCGDWLVDGSVEGAWHSGRLLARAVLDQRDLSP